MPDERPQAVVECICRGQLRRLEQEVEELRSANELLTALVAFFAPPPEPS